MNYWTQLHECFFAPVIHHSQMRAVEMIVPEVCHDIHVLYRSVYILDHCEATWGAA